MFSAIAEDFLNGGLEVIVPIDARTIERHQDSPCQTLIGVNSAVELPGIVADCPATADHVLMIAPETDACLLSCLNWVNASNHKLISPDAAFVELTSSKNSTFEYLQANGFHSFPREICLISNSQHDDQPMVIKPISGAGSEGVELISNLSSCSPELLENGAYRLEAFVAGTHVSVSVICRPEGNLLLPPTRQVFDREPFGKYVGAEFPVEPSIAARASRLAERVMQALPKTKGYLGIDIVISNDGPAGDCVIEINPRLTMSYLTLRQICNDNLALKMLM